MDAAEIIANLPEDRCEATLANGMRCVAEIGHDGAHRFDLAADEEPDATSESAPSGHGSDATPMEELPEGFQPCPLCQGGGRVPDVLQMAKDAVVCPDCYGLGKVARPTLVQEELLQVCSTCNGAGWKYQPPPELERQPQAQSPLEPAQQF